MRGSCLVIGGLCALLAGCTKHNPASCCTSDQQCFDLGLSQIYPCAGDQVCDQGTCRPPQCEVSADCSGTTRFCINHLCVQACTSNDDCGGDPNHPYCEPSGSCGQCLNSSTCAAATPVCDAATSACRGCVTGAECPSQACDLSSGACLDATTLAYVSNGGTDTGSCSVTSPCRTVDYAAAQLGNRTTIYALGSAGSVYTLPISVHMQRSFVLASEHVTVSGPDPLFIAGSGESGKVSLHSLTLGSTTDAGMSFKLSAPATLELVDVKIERPFQINDGTVRIADSVIDGTGTSAAALTIQRSSSHAALTITAGSLRFDSVRFEGAGATAVTTSAGATNVQIIDSLMISNGMVPVLKFNDIASVAFCTFVSTQPSATAPVGCGGTNFAGISSSINAWNGLAGSCSYDHSLFATDVAPPIGTGNQSGQVAGFFVDPNQGDYHPSPTSAARGGGNPTAPGADHDIDAHSRPASPDMGAFQSQ